MTLTSIVIEMPTFLLAPTLSICVHYGNILNHEGEKFKDGEELVFEKRFTVKQILDRIPSAERGFFEKCLYRYPMSFALREYIGDECFKIFHIDKFFTQVSSNLAKNYVLTLCVESYRVRLAIIENKNYSYTNLA